MSVGSTLPTSLHSVCSIFQYLSVCLTADRAGRERLGECFLWTRKGGTDPSITNIYSLNGGNGCYTYSTCSLLEYQLLSTCQLFSSAVDLWYRYTVNYLYNTLYNMWREKVPENRKDRVQILQGSEFNDIHSMSPLYYSIYEPPLPLNTVS